MKLAQDLPGRAIICFILVSFTWALPACSRPIFTPTIIQGATEKTAIPVHVRLAQIVDASPADDQQDSWWSGQSTTSVMAGPLANVVAEAIFNDFRFRGLFAKFDKTETVGYLVLSGTVYRFYERRNEHLWTWCCGLLGALLPFPSRTETGEVALQLTLSRPDGAVVKTFRGRSVFIGSQSSYSDTTGSNPGVSLNRAFNDVLSQIRQQMIDNHDLILTQASK